MSMNEVCVNGDKVMDGLTGCREVEQPRPPHIPHPGDDLTLKVPGSHEGERGNSLE